MERKVEIFLCYARKDQAMLNELRTHLVPMVRLNLINIWQDVDISPGAAWEEEIDKHLSTAHIILLLISPDFMDSDYCYSKEMIKAMERHERGEAHVIPVLLRSVYWQGAAFGKLQVLPTDARPVTKWQDRDDAFFDIAEGVRKVAEEWISVWLAYEQARQQEELAREQARQQEELAREQARQREELAREQARQQEELTAQRVRQQQDWAAIQRELELVRLRRHEDRKTPIIEKSADIVGIDLGTTNSCIAVVIAGRPLVIPNAEGVRTTPSIVALNSKGEWLIGEAAKQQAITNAESTIYSIKRFIGRKYDDPEVDRDKRSVPYKVICADNGDAWVEIEGKPFSPIEISAKILQKLKSDAEAYLGKPVTQAVITVPSYFNDEQRQATRDAGKIAGLDVLRIVNEPTAASLAYGLDKKKDERIAVYDMGGGTFNISILELGDGIFEVKSTNGDTHLGGEDFTQRVMHWLADEFRKEHDIDLRQDRMSLQRLKEAAEKAKKELSSLMTTEINLPFITSGASGPKHLNKVLTRATLEQLVEELIEKSNTPVTKALSDACVRGSEINEVVLVGGQTRMPAVEALVKRIFDREPHRGVSRDEVVAAGAAIQAGVLAGQTGLEEILLLDVIPFSLGIETLGGVFTRLIERNTTIPTQKSQVFSTSSDGQASFEVHILQGEREFAKDNRSLGCFTLDGIPPAPRGTPQIEITFDIDQDNTLRVSARDKGSGREQNMTISVSSGLNQEQINHLREDVEAYVLEGKLRRELAEERNIAESLCLLAEKILAELGDRLTLKQKEMLLSLITKVRSAITMNRVDDIKSSNKELERVFHQISENIYNQLFSENASHRNNSNNN